MAETTLPSFAPGTLDARVEDPALAAAVAATLDRADEEHWSDRLRERDATLWSSDPAVQAKIANRLGWLDLPVDFTEQIPALEGSGEAIRDAGFTTAIVAGMGGSSLAPGVIADAFRDVEGWLEVRVLDSTDPAAVRAAWEGLDPLATLVIVGSKSGTTTETLAFQADAWQRIHDALRAHGARTESPGEFMVAVTDPGRSLAAIPHQDEMRGVFLNPESVGGRYSALSYVGLVPASVAGVDLDPFLASAAAMHARCAAADPAANPGVALGATIGALAVAGRDKLTFVVDPALGPLGAWLEQLVAESTGKLGTGIVPIDREPLGIPASYGPDRVFARIALDGSAPPAPAPDGTPADALLDALAAAGHPILRFTLADPIDLAGEFLRWEVATAIAGIVLGINPFDEPNVTESKENTKRVLEELERRGSLPAEAPLATGNGLALHGDTPLRLTAGDGTVVGELRRHLERARRGGFLAVTAFVAPTADRAAAIDRIRARLRDGTGLATTGGFGPRYLHSTGQLHKGGPAIGWFLQLTADHPADVPVPGRHYTFAQLIDAQARGDFEALEAHELPVLRVHLGADVDAGLAALEAAVAAALPR
ncbi:MAG: transaldolase [Chloroflexi bacterium]|nr:transaldolase [Chloroflexota bacterium]